MDAVIELGWLIVKIVGYAWAATSLGLTVWLVYLQVRDHRPVTSG